MRADLIVEANAWKVYSWLTSAFLGHVLISTAEKVKKSEAATPRAKIVLHGFSKLSYSSLQPSEEYEIIIIELILSTKLVSSEAEG